MTPFRQSLPHSLFLMASIALGACSDDTEQTEAAEPDSTVDGEADGSSEPTTDTADDTTADGVDDTTQDDPGNYAETFRTVQIDNTMSVAEQLSVHACAGLYNGRLGGSIFVQTDEDVPQANLDGALVRDEIWLQELDLAPASIVTASDFLQECVDEFGGCLRYSYETQQEILPSILTIAAAEGVPPLSDESALTCAEPVVDAVEVLAERTTQLLATEYVYENYLDQTTGLAMLNPGYNRQASNLADPPMTDDMPMALIDLVFSRRIFVVFLINGCIENNPEQDLLSRIVNESDWPKPVGVLGYNDSWLVGGYTYEAQTRCLPSANMGAIPTRTTNLSFFDTRGPAIRQPDELPQNAPQELTYDPTKTYVAFVIGDGDNIRYIMSTRRDWLAQRLDRCADAEPACPPLTWTISPHLPDLAPDVLRWYYEAASTTGADYFMLPPSGYQYAYPGGLAPESQATFAAATEEAARILSTRSTIHWEWVDGWENAVAEFFPRYATQGGQIQGVFPMNVPYVIEAFPDWPFDQQYQIIRGADGGQTVLFRSRSWRGVDGRDSFHPTPERMAERLAAFAPGTVTWIYMTSDGGLNLENSYVALTEILPENVVLFQRTWQLSLRFRPAGTDRDTPLLAPD